MSNQCQQFTPDGSERCSFALHEGPHSWEHHVEDDASREAAKRMSVRGPSSSTHFCAFCHHRWEGDDRGAEHCGDCHRAFLALASASPQPDGWRDMKELVTQMRAVIEAVRAVGARGHWDAPHWTLYVSAREANALFDLAYELDPKLAALSPRTTDAPAGEQP